MKKLLIALLLLTGVVMAQTANVTLQVTDLGGQAWNNGTWSVQLTPAVGTSANKFIIIATGAVVPNQFQAGSLDGTGSALVVVTPNTAIAPANTQWTFSVCPNATAPCVQSAITVAGNMTYNATPPAIAINMNIPQARVTAYNDNELFAMLQGNQYFNVTTLQTKVWNGSAWVAFTSGSAGLADPGSNGVLKRTALNVTAIANAADIIAMFGGGCSGSTALLGNGTCGVVGGGNVTTTPGAGVNQNIVQLNGTTAGANIFAKQRYVDASWNWSFIDSAGSIGNLSVAGSNTLTLPSGPLGINASGFTASQYSVYISGVGTPEAVPVTGGTCISGATSSCTIIVTTANTHGAGFTVGSATQGIQEAINDACRGGPTNYGTGSIGGNCDVELLPSGLASTPSYTVQAPIYLDGRASRNTLNGNAAYILCNTRSMCIYSGNRNLGSGYNIIQNVTMQSNINFDNGAQIADVTAVAGTYTVHTAIPHTFSMTGNAGLPDFVDVMFNVFEGVGGTHYQSHIVVPVASVPDNTHFTYVLGSNTFANATGFGYVALENTMIEDNADGTVIRDLRYRGTPGIANYVIIVDNDQATIIDHLVTNGSGVKCTVNFCGAILYSRGDQGNSSIIQLSNSELSNQCAGNGILARGGNGLYIQSSVIQGFAQYGLYSAAGLHSTSIKDVHFEASGCLNPLYGLSLANAGAIFDGGINSYTGVAPFPDGAFPKFATGGSGTTQRNYFIVVHSSLLGVTIPIPIGFAQPVNGATVVNVVWPVVISNGNLGTVTYDVLVTINSAVQTPLTGTGNFSIATGISGSCGTNGMCSFSDTQAASSSYTVAAEQWYPGFWYMPGGAVLSNSSSVTASSNPMIILDNAQTGRFTASTKKLPQVVATHWEPSTITGSNGMIGGLVVEAYGASATGPGNFSFYMAQKDAGNNGPALNSKGRVNLGSEVATPNHLMTWKDSNFDKTASTWGMRPLSDANDCYTGEDQSGGLSNGCNVSISNYIANIGDGTSWKERLTSSLKSFSVPVTSTGVITGLSFVATAGAWTAGTIASIGDVLCPSANTTASDCTHTGPLNNIIGIATGTVGTIFPQTSGFATLNYDGTVSPSAGWFACRSVITDGKVLVQAATCPQAQHQVGIIATSGVSVTSGNVWLTPFGSDQTPVTGTTTYNTTWSHTSGGATVGTSFNLAVPDMVANAEWVIEGNVGVQDVGGISPTLSTQLTVGGINIVGCGISSTGAGNNGITVVHHYHARIKIITTGAGGTLKGQCNNTQVGGAASGGITGPANLTDATTAVDTTATKAVTWSCNDSNGTATCHFYDMYVLKIN